MRRHELVEKKNTKGYVFIYQTAKGDWEIWYKERNGHTKYDSNLTKESAISKAKEFAEINKMEYTGVSKTY